MGAHAPTMNVRSRQGGPGRMKGVSKTMNKGGENVFAKKGTKQTENTRRLMTEAHIEIGNGQ